MLHLSSLLLCLISFLVLTLPSSAFQMQPVGTEYDRKLAKLDESKAERLLEKIVDKGAPKFLEPVHEEITQRIYECSEDWGDKPSCAKQKLAPKAVIDGARWNDNPPFMVNNDFTLPVYCAQDAKKHKTEDVYDALRNDAVKYSPNVIDVGRVLRRLYHEQNSDWEVVKKYLDECVFVLKDSDAEADGGKFETN